MVKVIFGVFMVLHGLVHLLYVGQSQRVFELQPGMVWPDGSWAFSGLVGDETGRKLASLLLVLAAIGFVIGGAGIFVRLSWWRVVIVGAAILSTALYILFWNGTLQNVDDQGAIGILINVAILAAVLIFRWPNLGF